MCNNDKTKECNCGVRIATQKERYEIFRNEVNSVKSELMGATTADAVNVALDNLEALMKRSVQDIQLQNITCIADIYGSINSVRRHDRTRKEMDSMLEQMLSQVNDLLSAEQEKELAGKLKEFFLACAENAEAIAKLVDIRKIVG